MPADITQAQAMGKVAVLMGGVSAERLFTPEQSAGHLLRVLAEAGPGHSGGVWAWDGTRVPF